MTGHITETQTREKLIALLLEQGHQKDNIKLEHTIKIDYGFLGRNHFKIIADLAVLDDEGNVKIIAEVKKQQKHSEKHKQATSNQVLNYQIKPALNFIKTATLGIYYDGQKIIYLEKDQDGKILEPLTTLNY